MITLVINGRPYQFYEQISLDRSMDKIAGEFSFNFVNTAGQAYPLNVDDECEVQVFGQTKLKGHIETINGSGDSGSHVISVAGRDKFADIIDSTIGGNIEFKAPISLEDVVKQTLSKMGITGIGIINNVPDLDSFSSSDLIAAKTGDSVFKFLESYARKRQVLLSSDNTDNIVLTRSSTVLQATPLLHKIAFNGNNVKSFNYNYDITKRFNKYILRSQGNPSTDDNAVNFTLVSGTGLSSTAIDSDIHANRILNKKSEQSTDISGLQKRAAWEANIRKARSFTYSAVVQGFNNQLGQLWEVNTLVQVIDDIAGVNSNMLINSVKFDLSSSGSLTTLTLVRPDAYTLDLEDDQKNKKDKNAKKVQLVFDPKST
jgi:prophage tail gpP-like protein